MKSNTGMLRYIPTTIMILVGLMLFGMVGHGAELFYRVEGGKLNSDWLANIVPAIKALFFPLAFECGNAVALFVLFHREIKSWWARSVAIVIGVGCLATSYLIQYHYYAGKTEADFWYSGVLPLLVGFLSALAGLLDRKVSEEQPKQQQEEKDNLLLGVLVNQLEKIGNNQQTTMTAIGNLQTQLANTVSRLDKVDDWIIEQKTRPELPQPLQLKDWERKALEMANTGKFTQQQIADEVGRSRPVVNQLIQRVKSEVKE